MTRTTEATTERSWYREPLQWQGARSATAALTRPLDTAAAKAQRLIETLLGKPVPVRFEFFDGSALGPTDGPGTVRVRSVNALRRIIWAPGELGLARAFVSGDVELEGDIIGLLGVLQHAAPQDLRFLGVMGSLACLDAARRFGALGPPLPPPAEEVLPRGRRHSTRRDAASVRHHYDVGNDFYRLVLGPTVTYSCARFADDTTDLENAQRAKFELICRKLGLHERRGARLLDVGCGWGSMAMHAAARHGATAVGITISPEQADLARRRLADAGLAEQVEIRLQDYRELPMEEFDAISSIGMFEHVGRARQSEYFSKLRTLLRPGGRLLNHAISRAGSSRPARRSFIYRYVFPDSELLDVGETILAMEAAGFEVRDVESLREHYSRTLRAWVGNLERRWHEAVSLVGERRARIWRLYMAGCANRFSDGQISVHQVLGVVNDDRGRSFMPRTRAGWEP
ncbi:MAG: cyclopropane-fatty-acyl-phospholipid synthase family protein [Actinomycetota bacterium]|nr:cyclopropane-fatty-acyl-phospholipid synthase family protein [Actinomycetota bacterium]